MKSFKLAEHVDHSKQARRDLAGDDDEAGVNS
jgi:hypothetical protein